MSDYSQITDFSAKDALSSGDAEKKILGADVDAEFDAISTAIATKYDSTDIASIAEAQAESLNTKLITPSRLGSWADGNAGMVGDIQALTDPNADRLLFWDDSASAAAFLSPDGTTIAIAGTTLSTGSNVPLLDAANTFTASNPTVTLSASIPMLRWNETDAAADNKRWLMFANGETFAFATNDDADTTNGNIMLVNRTGTTVDSLALTASTITLNGVASSDFARLSASNTFTGAQQSVSNAAPSYRLTDGTNIFDVQLNSGVAEIVQRANNSLKFYTNGTLRAEITSDGTLQYGGREVGYRGVPQTTASANFTLGLDDAGRHILLTNGSLTCTVPANSSQAFPIGAAIVLVGFAAGATHTVSPDTGVTLYKAGVSFTSGSATLNEAAVATLVKVGTNTWAISGSGVS